MSIEFILDGRTVTAEPGQTIMDVAKANGIRIPGLCGEARISKTTSCFVCVVRDKKTGRFLPSCAAKPSQGQEIDASSPEVLDMRKTALSLLLSEHTGDCEAPCTMACPAHASVEEYVRAGRKGEFLKSLEIIKKRIPLPMSIGRVCPRFCEKQCRRNVYGEPVAINDFKRLAADLHYDEYMEELPELTGKKVAIVGAGPAGLSAAYYLRLEGIEPTLFDAQPKAGGMLRYGIPEYRLPKATLDRELAHFPKMGIHFEFGRKLGDNLSLDELKAYFEIDSALSLYDVLNSKEVSQWRQKWAERRAEIAARRADESAGRGASDSASAEGVSASGGVFSGAAFGGASGSGDALGSGGASGGSASGGASGGGEFCGEFGAARRPSAASQLLTLLRRRYKLFFRDTTYLFLTLAISFGFPLVVVIFALGGLRDAGPRQKFGRSRGA